MNKKIIQIFGKNLALNGYLSLRQGWICLVLLTLPLAACSSFVQAAPGQTPTSTQPPEIVGESLPCLTAGEGEVSFVNDKHGYCLLYPAGFTADRPEPNVVVIHGPNYSAGPEPLTGFVNIQQLESAQGRSAAQVSDGVVAEFQEFEDIIIERVDTLLDGEPAVEIIGVPGQSLSWHIVTIHQDRVYQLVFSPLGEENGQAFSDMQKLYDIVMQSFTFLD